jgi:hypothetical protein
MSPTVGRGGQRIDNDDRAIFDGETKLVTGNRSRHRYLLESWISSLAPLIVRLAVAPGADEFGPTA